MSSVRELAERSLTLELGGLLGVVGVCRTQREGRKRADSKTSQYAPPSSPSLCVTHPRTHGEVDGERQGRSKPSATLKATLAPALLALPSPAWPTARPSLFLPQALRSCGRITCASPLPL